jgi:hypothetical protein
MNTESPNFEEFAELIRQHQGFRQDKRIVPEMQFERDLGITGDDGSEIVDVVAERYGIELTAEFFGLVPNEFLFHSEGFDLVPAFVRSLLRKPEPEVRSFTVGELFEAVQRAVSTKSQHQTKAPQIARSFCRNSMRASAIGPTAGGAGGG